MRQRGRKSSASLGIVSACEEPRPAPPRSMERRAKALWRQTTARFRPEHFIGAEPVLEAYVGAVVTGRDLHKMVEQTKASEPVDYKRLAILMSLLKAQGFLIARLASSLRLSPKSKYDRTSAQARPQPMIKPWDLCRGSPDDKPPPRSGSPFDGAA